MRCTDQCAWTSWRGHIDVKDMLARQCRTCGAKEIRVLPPDVPRRVQDVRDLTWGEGYEEGAE